MVNYNHEYTYMNMHIMVFILLKHKSMISLKFYYNCCLWGIRLERETWMITILLVSKNLMQLGQNVFISNLHVCYPMLIFTNVYTSLKRSSDGL